MALSVPGASFLLTVPQEQYIGLTLQPYPFGDRTPRNMVFARGGLFVSRHPFQSLVDTYPAYLAWPHVNPYLRVSIAIGALIPAGGVILPPGLYNLTVSPFDNFHR